MNTRDAPKFRSPQDIRSRSGVALVLVLCFVVLLTALTLALLSRSLSSGLISGASGNGARANLYAHGAIDQIIGDLRQEIVDGSLAKTYSTVTIYRPLTAGTAVPYNAGPATYTSTTWNSVFPNLVKQSASGVPFYQSAGATAYNESGPIRAAASPSTTVSRNGRSVSLARWNEPLLLPKKSATVNPGSGGTPTTLSDGGTDTTPSTLFVAPDWILSAVDGSNPGTTATPFNASPTDVTTGNVNPKSLKFVVGRYAYTIYNEGGLLDANVAGGPATATMSPAQEALASRKGPSAFADLTQLPGIAQVNGTGMTPQTVVNQLVSWRNYATTQPSNSFPSYTFGSVDNYLNYLLGISTRFMSTNSSNGQTDRAFTSRQQLISFLQDLVPSSDTTDQAYLQDAMMYLGTFSRTLNQPSFWPDPSTSRPVVVGTVTSGGNSAYGYDTPTTAPASAYNPPFGSICVTTSFVRPSGTANNDPTDNPDGSTAIVGEPLVKKRFALRRLLWLTYKGPSVNVPLSDPSFQFILTNETSGNTAAAQNALDQLRAEGTPANILNYFGLTWTPGAGTGGIGGYWTYDHGMQSGGTNYIGLLGAVASLPASQAREPDFFELLKAAITAGSLAKPFAAGTDYQSALDSRVDMEILPLGANIIDEVNPTQYPTQIQFNDAGFVRRFYGKQDLPYLDNLTNVAFISQVANPPATDATGPPQTYPMTPPLKLGGTGVALLVPILWNPYAYNASMPTPTVAPSALRASLIDVPITDPGLINNAPTSTSGTIRVTPRYNGPIPTPAAPAPPPIGASQAIIYPNWGMSSAQPLAELHFSNIPTLFREPTPLIQNTVTSITNVPMSLGLASNSTGMTNGIIETGSNLNLYGFLYGTFAQRFIATASDNNNYVFTLDQIALQVVGTTAVPPHTFRMEYQTPSGAWVPYEEVACSNEFVPISIPFTESDNSTDPCLLTPATSPYWNGTPKNWALRLYENSAVASPAIGEESYDPRTGRWELPGDVNAPPLLFSLPGSVQSPRPATTVGTTTHGIGTSALGLYPQSSDNVQFGAFTQNIYSSGSSPGSYYTDPDGVVRRAMGAYVGGGVNASTPIGLPMASTISYTGYVAAPTQMQSRPIILHRPFRSVAELGYVFRDTPWKNIDFFTPESGDTALLDVFCINEDYRPDAVSAGRVDLNGKQAPVFQALLAGAFRDEAQVTTPSTYLSDAEAAAISQALVTRTTSTVSNMGPLINIGELVGRYVSGGYKNAFSQPYDGFSNDLSNLYSPGTAATQSSPYPSGSYNIIQPFRETTMRALSDAGQAGTWNLMIDVIAQSGRFPINATGPTDFLVEGERRYWVHVAIDRQTGQIVDEKIEAVTE